MVIERHIFGSYSGYTTLARSAGVSADDARLLEGSSFAFGQTSDRSYLKGLRRSNAYFTRILRGNRRGLTKIVAGNDDDAGRPTLLMITAVVTQRDWDVELCGDVAAMLDDATVWQWNGEGDVPTLEVTYPLPSRGLPRKAAARVLALLSELERQMQSRQPVVVRGDDFSFDEIRSVELLIPAAIRPYFTSAYLSLSSNLPVNLNCLAPEADSQSPTFRPTSDVQLSPYAAFLERSTSLMGGTLPLGDVLEYRQFARRGETAGDPAPQAPVMAAPPVKVIHRMSVVRVTVMLVLCALLAGGAGFLVGTKWRYPAEGQGKSALPPGNQSTTQVIVNEVDASSTPSTSATTLRASSQPVASAVASAAPESATSPTTRPTSQSARMVQAVEISPSLEGRLRELEAQQKQTALERDVAISNRKELQNKYRLATAGRLTLARAAYDRVLTLNSVDQLTNAAPVLQQIVETFNAAPALEGSPDIAWWDRERKTVVDLESTARVLLDLRETLRAADPKKAEYSKSGTKKQRALHAEIVQLSALSKEQLKKLEEQLKTYPERTDVVPLGNLKRKQAEYSKKADELKQWVERWAPADSGYSASPSGEKNPTDH